MDLPEFFGIDIGASSIKVAQAKRKGNNQADLVHLAKVDTPVGLLENESDEGTVQLAAKLNEVREAAGIKTKYCVLSVPESAIFSRLLTIPSVAPEGLEEAVHWEVKPLIPVPLADVDIAFLDIGEKELAGKKLIDMYVVAAPKTLTDRYKSIAEKAGLETLAIETEALATARALTFAKKLKEGMDDVVIVDFGASSTNIILARQGVVVFTQTSSTGADAFTKAIAADYGIDLVEAEKYKRAFGIDFNQGEGKIAKAIEPIMQIVLTDITRAINYFRERVGGKVATTVLLTGSGANLPGLTTYLQTKHNIESEIVDLMSSFTIDSKLKQQIEAGGTSGLSVCLGLALKTQED